MGQAQVYIRKAGFWNAKNFKLESQFGHIMIRLDKQFYSFNQNKFLPEGTEGCVQIMTEESFETRYRGQIWYVITLNLGHDYKKIVKHIIGV